MLFVFLCVCVLQHDDVPKAIEYMINSHRRGIPSSGSLGVCVWIHVFCLCVAYVCATHASSRHQRFCRRCIKCNNCDGNHTHTKKTTMAHIHIYIHTYTDLTQAAHASKTTSTSRVATSNATKPHTHTQIHIHTHITYIHRPDTSGTCIKDNQRFPRRYIKCDDCDENEVIELLKEEERMFESPEEHHELDAVNRDARMVVYTPPAVTSADSYNVLKFYALDDDIVRSFLSRARHDASSHRPGYGNAHADVVQEYPFIPDEVRFGFVCVLV